MLRRLLLSFWYLCASLVVVAALLLSVARLALPLLEEREGQLVGLVHDTLGQDARIGGLELSWRGLGPELRVTDFALLDKESGQALLSALELRVGIDLWASLWAGRLMPSRLIVIGSELELYRDASGRMGVRGIRLKAPAIDPWLLVLSQPRVELRDLNVQWTDELKQIPDLVLSSVDLHLVNRGKRHQLQAYLRLAGELGQELTVAADLIGSLDRRDAWHGQFYARVDQLPLQPWLRERLPGGLNVAGIADVQLWGDVLAGRIQHVLSEVTIADPNIRARADGSQLFQAQRLAGQLDWRRAAAGWTLELERVRVTQSQGLWPETGLTLAVLDRPEGEHQVQLALGHLRLESIDPWLNYVLKLSPEHRELVDQLQVGGAVEAVQLAFTTQAGWIEDLSFQFQFRDVHNQAVERLPGSRALSGRVAGDADYGVLTLDARDGAIDLPRLFRAPLEFSRLQGALSWHRRSDRLRFETSALAAENADIATATRLRLELPLDGGKPFLDLQTAFRRGRVEDAHKYLPVGIMPPKTVAWLDRALVSGRVASGAALFHGRLGDFPFDRANGRFEVRATVADAVLDYREGWHRIEGLEAELAFINRTMRIHGVAGQVLGSELTDVDVGIDDLAHARLTVDGHAHGELADMLRFLRESPLGEGKQDLLGGVQATGAAALRLGLNIPLAEPTPPVIDGRVTLDGNSLGVPARELVFEQLEGELQFTQASVTASGISGRLFDVPVRVDVEDARIGGQDMTRIRAVGKLPVLDRLRQTGGDLWNRFSGTSQWTGSLSLPKFAANGGGARLELASDLQGTAIDLPVPFGKAAADSSRLRLQTDVSTQGSGPLTLQYADHSAVLEFGPRDTGLSLLRGEVKLGAADARLPQEQGLRITGTLDSFDWNAWRPLLAPDQPGGADPVGSLVALLDVHIGTLQALGRRFREVSIEAHRADTSWQVQLSGPDTAGTLALPDKASAPITGTFDHLRLPAMEPAAASAPPLTPASIPGLELDIARFEFRDLDLGHVTLHTHRLDDGLAVDRLSVEADWIQLATHGEWTQRAGRDGSRFNIELQGGKLERLLATFGYAGGIQDGEVTGTLDVNWPGTPADFELQRLEGTLSLRVGPGRLLNVEAGAGRVLGLFSLQGIRRRLALDFSDVFEKGFSFDRIEGHFTLLDSDAYTNDLVIEGPAARVEISGRTGLARQDYDQLVTVIPQVQSTLPIAGALAGGPVVGAALLLADKLFAQQMEGLTSFTRYQYTVTGSWQDPQFKPLPRLPAAQDGQDKAPTNDE